MSTLQELMLKYGTLKETARNTLVELNEGELQALIAEHNAPLMAELGRLDRVRISQCNNIIRLMNDGADMAAKLKAYAQQQTEPAAELLDKLNIIYQDIYRHKDVAIVANSLHSLLAGTSYTHLPATVPLKKYDKLLDALKVVEAKIKALPRFNFLLNANGNGVAKWENKSGDWIERYEVTNIIENAIAELEGKI